MLTLENVCAYTYNCRYVYTQTIPACAQVHFQTVVPMSREQLVAEAVLALY